MFLPVFVYFRCDCSPAPLLGSTVQVFASLPHPLKPTTWTSKPRRVVLPAPRCHGRVTLREAGCPGLRTLWSHPRGGAVSAFLLVPALETLSFLM